MEDLTKYEEIEIEILKVFEECKEGGLTREEIYKVFSPLGIPNLIGKSEKSGGSKVENNAKKDNKTSFLKNPFSWSNIKKLLFLVTLAVVAITIISHPNSQQELKNVRFHALAILRIALIKVLPYWNWTDIYYSRCLVPNPFFETPNLNPDDCNLCESEEEIIRMWNVSQTTVIEEYIRREKPFIVADGMHDWHIMKTDQFWFDNMTEIYLKHESYRVCNVNTNLRVTNGDFTRLLKRLYNPRTQQWFIHWENCQKELAKSVRQFYRRPYFISNSLDFTGSNWVLMSSNFKGRVYKKIEASDSLVLIYQIRGFNHIRISPRETCRGFCPELTQTLEQGEILVVTSLLWILEYIPGEDGDNLAILSEVSAPSIE